MMVTVAELTLAQVVGQRRTLLVALLALLPVAVALIVRFAAGADLERVEAGSALIENMVVHLVLPLTALVIGTAALGQEFEDGTAVYLLARPVPRWRILAGKLLATWVVASAAVLVSVVGVGAALLLGEPDGTAVLAAFALAMPLGALGYLALFLCLSILFNRALIIGLIYVFVWEATITAFAPGAQNLSVREYTIGIAGALADAGPEVLDASLGAGRSFVLLGVVTAAALAYGVRALARYEFASSG